MSDHGDATMRNHRRVPAQGLLAGALLCGAAFPLLGGEAGTPALVPPFTYTRAGVPAAAALTAQVSPAGLCAIRVGGRDVATGAWHVEDATWLLSAHSAPPPPATRPPGDMQVLSPAAVRVHHAGTDVAADFDYRFDGEDIHIRARVENLQPRQTISAVLFRGLRFQFSGKPQGYVHDWDTQAMWSLTAKRRGFHPSWETPFGGSYVHDATVGIGLSPRYPALQRTLFSLAGGSELLYLAEGEIPPGGARVFQMTLRVSTDRRWTHLLDPYREHFRATFGPVRYRADVRPIAQYVAADGAHGGPGTDNPAGWSWYMLDRPEFDSPQGARGLNAFIAHATAALERARAQGIIIWNLTGHHPRGCNYRPDFDVLPPGLQQHLGDLRGLRTAGYRLGALARPGQIATPGTWDQDILVEVSPDAPSQMEAVWTRFRNLIDAGFSCFYLDSFGEDFEDFRIMQALRERLGPDTLTFTEFWTDVSLVHSGGYLELDVDVAQMRYSEFWHRLQLWEMCRWLCPGVQAISHTSRADASLAKAAAIHTLTPRKGGRIGVRLTERPAAPTATPAAAEPVTQARSPAVELTGEDPGDSVGAEVDDRTMPSPLRFLFENGITPMFYFGSSRTGPLTEALHELVPEFVDDHGQWRETPASPPPPP